MSDNAHSSSSKDTPNHRRSDISDGKSKDISSTPISGIQEDPSTSAIQEAKSTGISSNQSSSIQSRTDFSRKRDQLQSEYLIDNSRSTRRRQDVPVELHELGMMDFDSVRIVRVDMVLDASYNNADISAAIVAFRTKIEECQLLKIGRFHGDTLTTSTPFDDAESDEEINHRDDVEDGDEGKSGSKSEDATGKDDTKYKDVTMTRKEQVVILRSLRSTIGALVIPDSITTIATEAFSDCKHLTSVLIPESVIIIDGGAFEGCTGLTDVVIPYSVHTIGEGAFYSCIGLTAVAIPDSVHTICEWAFEGCIGLTSVAIPDSVHTIGEGAFSNCTGLTEVVVPDHATIGTDAFPAGVTLTLSSEVVEIQPLK